MATPTTSSSISELLLPVVAVSAAATVGALALLQSDSVSCRILNPKQLQIKRRQEYKYKWQTAREKARLQQHYFLAGKNVATIQEDPDYVAKRTDYISKEEELQGFVQKIFKSTNTITNTTATTSSSSFHILGIDKDPQDPTGEYYLYLLQEDNNNSNNNEEHHRHQLENLCPIQVPLIAFGNLLYDAFDRQITTTTLCFIADASTGKASQLLEQLVVESKTGVAVVSEPLWMIDIAMLAQSNTIAKERLEKLVFALCRLEAWRLQDQIKDTSRTVMITLPGQATTPILLPLLQKVFPEDRHVFAYDGCVASVQRGIHLSKQLVHTYNSKNKSNNKTSTGLFRRTPLANSIAEICSLSSQAIVPYTTPISSTLQSKMTGLLEALAALPASQAELVETWMASVDTFFTLKDQDNTNGYLPYVFKTGFLTDGSFEHSSDSYWSLCSILQYITGCRSRPLPEGVIDAAAEWLKDYNRTTNLPTTTLSSTEVRAIENSVFQHKSILIGNKTLLDTVLPRQHWTLKQASRKGGCACCAPEEEDEEENGNSEEQASNSVFTNGLSRPSTTKSSKETSDEKSSGVGKRYVDGKLGFAFDPSRF